MRVDGWLAAPRTVALKRVSARIGEGDMADSLFLERWEAGLVRCPSVLLRIRQIRRANPVLAAEIRAELAHGGSLVRGGAARLSAATRLSMESRGPVRAGRPREHAGSGLEAAGEC